MTLPASLSFSVSAAEKVDSMFIVESQIEMALETEAMELDRETVIAGVEAIFQNPLLGKYYLAKFEGVSLGCLLTTFEWSDWRNGMILWIQSVYVMPEARKKGVYKAMYEHLKSKVLKPVPGEMPYRGLRLYVDKRNQTANQTYSTLGMNKEHYEMYEWMKEP